MQNETISFSEVHCPWRMVLSDEMIIYVNSHRTWEYMRSIPSWQWLELGRKVVDQTALEKKNQGRIFFVRCRLGVSRAISVLHVRRSLLYVRSTSQVCPTLFYSTLFNCCREWENRKRWLERNRRKNVWTLRFPHCFPSCGRGVSVMGSSLGELVHNSVDNVNESYLRIWKRLGRQERWKKCIGICRASRVAGCCGGRWWCGGKEAQRRRA